MENRFRPPGAPLPASQTRRIRYVVHTESIATLPPMGRRPLPAVRDLTCDGSWSNCDVSGLKLSQVSFRGKCARTGHSLKLPSPTNLARLGLFLQLGRCSVYLSFLCSLHSAPMVFPDFQPMRVSEEPVCIDLFRQNPFLPPVHVVPPQVLRMWIR